MKGVILAAGKGSRLYPVTYHIPKPLLPLANRMTLAYAFDRLKELGITEVCLVVGESERAMRDSLGAGAEHGVSLSYVRQHEPKGLAHALGFAREFVGDDDFVLYLGDAIYGGGFQQQFELFQTSRCANLNLVKQVDDPSRFGVATVDGDRIVRLVEKPAKPESNWAMAGLYFFRSAIWDVLPGLKPSARGEYEITDAIQTLIDGGHDVRAGAYEKEWFDTGTRESFLQTSRFLAGDAPLVGAGATIAADIGPGVVVGEGATVRCDRIENSVVLPGATVIAYGEVRGCLLGGGINVEGDLVDQIAFEDREPPA